MNDKSDSDQLVQPTASANETASSSVSFQVCKASYKHFNFTSGLMGPGSSMGIHGSPLSLNVYCQENSSGYYKYTIYVDCNKDPFHVLPPYPAQYYFTDQTNDTYGLFIMRAGLHQVSYNSTSPDINRIVIQGIGVPSNYWESAPACS